MAKKKTEDPPITLVPGTLLEFYHGQERRVVRVIEVGFLRVLVEGVRTRYPMSKKSLWRKAKPVETRVETH